MSGQSILTNTVIASGGRLVNVFLGIIIIALLTRYLGPGLYGQYALLLSFGTIIQLLADAGLYLTLAREIARPGSGDLVAHIVSLRLFLLAASFLGGALIAFLIPSLRPLLLPYFIIALGLSLQSLSQLAMAIFQHQRIVWRATLGDLAGRLVQLLVIWTAGVTAVTVPNMAIAFSAGALAAFLLHRWLLPPPSWRLAISWPAWRRLLAITWPLGAMLLVNAVYFRVDMVVLSFFRPDAEIGYYGLAYRLIESALFFPAMLGGLLLPRLSEAINSAHLSVITRYISEALQLVWIVGLLAVLVVWLEGGYILDVISGDSFRASLPLLKILSPSLIIMFTGNIFGFALIAYSRQKFLLRLYLFLTGFNLLANILFIPAWGAAAAAWTTIATEFLSTGFAGLALYRLAPFPSPLRSALPLLAAASLPMILSIIPWPLSSPWRLLLIVLLYAGGLWLFRFFGPRQFTLLRSSAA